MLKILCDDASYNLYKFEITGKELVALRETGEANRFNDPDQMYRFTILKRAAKSAIACVMDGLPTADYLKLSKVFLTRAFGKREVRLETTVNGCPWVCQKVLIAQIYTSFTDEELQKAIDKIIEAYKEGK
jgi:hypothetical protein